MTDIARRLDWMGQPPVEEEPRVEPRTNRSARAIPQGENFLQNPPEYFSFPEWNIEYELLQNYDGCITYVCLLREQSLVDLVIFLKNRRESTMTQVKALLKGGYKSHYFEDFNYPIASLVREHSHRNHQAHATKGQWSICKLLELTGICPDRGYQLQTTNWSHKRPRK